MNRRLRIALAIYFAGTIIMAAILVWKGIEGGGLERSHTVGDWALTVLLYAISSALWPVFVVWAAIFFATVILPHLIQYLIR